MPTAPAHQSDIDKLIPPEIKNDEFYGIIHDLARTVRGSSFLEIGSSSGQGSTEAFVRGLRENPSRPTLYCMEISRERIAALRATYAQDPFVRAYNVSSVPASAFPTAEQVTSFYCCVPTTLSRYPLRLVLGWLQQDLDYIASSGVPSDGIRRIKAENGIERFDLVLIDGSEFTGRAELDEVIGATWILLDDVNAYKCHEPFLRLSADPAYQLLRANMGIRNGYAVFARRDR